MVQELGAHDLVLGVPLLVRLQGLEEALQHRPFLAGKGTELPQGVLVVLVVVQGRPLGEQLLHGPPARLHGAAHAAQQKGPEEAGLGPLGQQPAELLGQVVGILQEGRQGDGVLVPLAVQTHFHRLEEGLAGFGVDGRLQVLAGAQDDVPDEGVRLLHEAREHPPDARLVRRAKVVEAAPWHHDVRIGQP